MSEKPKAEQVETLRAAAAKRMEATSLRQAAREIGMSPSGLHKFINGTDPYEPTLHRLRAWYGDDAAQRKQDEVVARFLGLLPAQRRAKAEGILHALLAGPVRERLVRDVALAEVEETEDRARLARGLSRLAERRRLAPAGGAGLGVEGVVILSALVELLDQELPVDAEVPLNRRRIGRDELLEALRRYVDRVGG
jgi:hypothetical protein